MSCLVDFDCLVSSKVTVTNSLSEYVLNLFVGAAGDSEQVDTTGDSEQVETTGHSEQVETFSHSLLSKLFSSGRNETASKFVKSIWGMS